MAGWLVDTVGAAVTSVAVAAALVVAPTTAYGAQPASAEAEPGVPEPPGTEPAPAEDPDDATSDLGALWRDAQAKLGTSDYEGAIEVLTRLYEVVVHDPEADALRQRVRWALHEAHVGAYGLEQDRAHLDVALDLLTKYRDALPEGDADGRREADTASAAVQALLDAHREAEPEPAPRPTPIADTPTPDPVTPPPDEPPPTDPSARPLIAVGAGLVGLGALGTMLLVAGLVSASSAVDTFETDPVRRDDARAAIRRGNAIGIAGGVVAGVFTVSGAILLGLGLQRRRGAIGPTAWRGGGGMTWVGRF